MSAATIDANGGIHDLAGKFSGHVQAEADTSVLAGSAVDLFGGVFAPVNHAPVEYGRFDVAGTHFFAEVVDDTTYDKGEPSVKFYDRRYPMHGKDGQFISSYYVSTLRENDISGKPTHGLNMHGGVPEWTIEGAEMATVMEELARRAPSHDGRTHQLFQTSLDLMDDDERDELAADLSSKPFGDDRTLAAIIRADGVAGSSDLPRDMIRLGTGETTVVSLAMLKALSKYPQLVTR